MNTDSLTLVLNTHMPWVLGRGPLPAFEQPETWLFEAITETYIPLFRFLTRWDARRFRGRLVLSFTPCLVRQLLACTERYLAHLERMQRIARAEIERTASLAAYNHFEKYAQSLSDQELGWLQQSARSYLDRIEDSLAFVKEHAFPAVLRRLAMQPGLELWTSSPHHNYLPFFNPAMAEYLVGRGVDDFEQLFGRRPDGFWLPECAYYPGLERALLRHDMRRTALHLHAIGAPSPASASGIYQAGELEVLIHDYRIAMHLWKAPADTYPAQPCYREFFRDLGFDVVPAYFERLGIELPPERQGQCWTGFKYHAISGPEVDLGRKRIYDPVAARDQALRHVTDFWAFLGQQRHLTHDHRTFVLAFDTELFGHWWHEGIPWLQGLLDSATQRLDDAPVTTISQAQPVGDNPRVPRLYYSTWGQDFYSEHWLTPDNCWMFALIKLAEAALAGTRAPELLGRFERLAGSDYLFLYPDPSQQALARDLFLQLFDDTMRSFERSDLELLTAFPVDPFKGLFVYATGRPVAIPLHLQVRRLTASGAETPRAVILEPEVRELGGCQIYFQHFPLQPGGRYRLRASCSDRSFDLEMPEFGVPQRIVSDLRAVPKYDHEKLYRKIVEIWQGDEGLPRLAEPRRHSRSVYTREAVHRVLGDRAAAVFKYNKEGYALLRFRDLALVSPVVVFHDTLATSDAAAWMSTHEAGSGIPVSTVLDDIERLDYDAVILTSSLNFHSEVEAVRRLVREAVRRRIPVLSLYDDVLYYDLLEEGADTSRFYRVAVPKADAQAASLPAQYPPPNVLGIFGTDTVQGKFTTQVYLRQALTQTLRVGHLATEPTGVLLGADFAYSRVLGVDAGQRLVFERQRMHALASTCDLVLTGGQNGLLFEPPGATRADNASTLLYNTFLPRLIVLTVSIATEPAEVHAAIAYLRSLAVSQDVPCEVVALAMMGGRKLLGARWTETYFLRVQDEVLRAARERMQRETGLPVHAIPEDGDGLAQAVLRRLRP